MPAESPRIAIVAPLKEWGGLERKFTILAEEFLRAGAAVDFVCIRGGQVPYPRQFPEAVTIVELPTQSKRDGIPAVARYLRERGPDAVLTAKDHAAQVVLLARAFARSPARVYVKTTNMPSEVIRRRFQRFMARRLYKRADGVIAISRGVLEDVVSNFRVPRDRVHLIYNPMVTRDFDARLAGRIEHPWGQDGGPPVILGAGRLTRQKGFATLIEAFAQLRQQRPCRLLIVGEGSERPALEALVERYGLTEDDVSLPGVVDDPVPLMRACSVFVLSSLYEGLGNVLVEALAAGTRLVATDCPSGPREILADGRHGRLVPRQDPATMAGAIDAALHQARPDPDEVEGALVRFRAGSVAQAYLEAMEVSPGG